MSVKFEQVLITPGIARLSVLKPPADPTGLIEFFTGPRVVLSKKLKLAGRIAE